MVGDPRVDIPQRPVPPEHPQPARDRDTAAGPRRSDEADRRLDVVGMHEVAPTRGSPMGRPVITLVAGLA